MPSEEYLAELGNVSAAATATATATTTTTTPTTSRTSDRANNNDRANTSKFSQSRIYQVFYTAIICAPKKGTSNSLPFSLHLSLFNTSLLRPFSWMEGWSGMTFTLAVLNAWRVPRMLSVQVYLGGETSFWWIALLWIKTTACGFFKQFGTFPLSDQRLEGTYLCIYVYIYIDMRYMYIHIYILCVYVFSMYMCIHIIYLYIYTCTRTRTQK